MHPKMLMVCEEGPIYLGMEVYRDSEKGLEMAALKVTRDGKLDLDWGRIKGSLSPPNFYSARNERLLGMAIRDDALLLVGHTLPESRRLAVARVRLADGSMDHEMDKDGKLYHALPEWVQRVVARTREPGDVEVSLHDEHGPRDTVRFGRMGERIHPDYRQVR